jgi:ketosteroid isomerase-like protein
MSRENVALVRKSFEAFKSGGFEAMRPLYAQDVVWRTAPEWVEDAVYRGHDGARKLSAVFTDTFEDLVLEASEIREVQDRVLVLVEATGRTKETGVLIHQPCAMVYSDFRDGMIGEVQFFFTWQDALEATEPQD